MSRVSCPRCGTVVSVPPSGAPTCPTCGFAGPAPGVPRPTAPAGMPAYGAPYAQTGYRRTNTKAILAMVFGIVGLVAFPLIGIVGWVLGAQARQEIRNDPNQDGDGMALAGIILGIICTVFLALIVLYFLFVFFFVFAAF